jgi:hypothetical protein
MLAPAALGLGLGLGLALAAGPRYRARVSLEVELRPPLPALSPATAEAMLRRRLPAVLEGLLEAEGIGRAGRSVEIRAAGAGRVELACEHREPASAAAAADDLAAALVDRAEAEASRTPPDASGGPVVPALVFRIVRPAGVSAGPHYPWAWLSSLTGLLAGLAAGLAAASLAERRDRSIRTPEELEELLGLPVLAEIPFVPARRSRR